MSNRPIKEQLSYDLLSLVVQYMELDKHTRNFGTDVTIYNSEIHLISAIAKNPGIHVKGLAELLGITSASVSEMLKKLEKKSLIQKQTDTANLSRLNITLTDAGMRAHEEHMRYHEIINDITGEELADATDEQILIIDNFLNGIRKRLNEMVEKV